MWSAILTYYFRLKERLQYGHVNPQRPESTQPLTKVGALCHTESSSSVGWLLEFYVLAASTVISRHILIRDSAHSLRHYSAAELGDQATRTMTWYPSQSHYPDTEPTSSCPILIMPSAWLVRKRWSCIFQPLVWLFWELRSALYQFDHSGQWVILRVQNSKSGSYLSL